jgi:hypothetical protein
MAEANERRPRARSGAHDDDHDVRASLARGPVTGCRCGCLTRLPWFDDPDCARHRPAPAHETCCNGEFGPAGWQEHCGQGAA